ncbi:MAG: hypothetical protein JNJ44_01405 [Zoogloeaceae bacterium]|nr:hypothetical protein [Zoogloeaceae bacterium]
MIDHTFTSVTLDRENEAYQGTTGVSAGNRSLGFRPGFLDRDTGEIFLSRFRDGRPAPFHLLDGLPDTVTERDETGKVRAAKATLHSGFIRGDRFYSREEAANFVSAA